MRLIERVEELGAKYQPFVFGYWEVLVQAEIAVEGAWRVEDVPPQISILARKIVGECASIQIRQYLLTARLAGCKRVV